MNGPSREHRRYGQLPLPLPLASLVRPLRYRENSHILDFPQWQDVRDSWRGCSCYHLFNLVSSPFLLSPLLRIQGSKSYALMKWMVPQKDCIEMRSRKLQKFISGVDHQWNCAFIPTPSDCEVRIEGSLKAGSAHYCIDPVLGAALFQDSRHGKPSDALAEVIQVAAPGVMRLDPSAKSGTILSQTPLYQLWLHGVWKSAAASSFCRRSACASS